MTFTKLKLDIEGAIARIWLDQPDTRNAFDDVVIAELTQAFVEAGVATGVRAWLDARARTIATLRCMGAPTAAIFARWASPDFAGEGASPGCMPRKAKM